MCGDTSAQTHKKSVHKSQPAKPAPPQKVKVAEGRYELKRTEGALDRSFSEPWTLYKTNLGYELEEQWLVGTGKEGETNIIDVKVSFVAGLNPIQVRIGGDDSPRQLLCSMALQEFKCASAGQEASMPVEGSYNFFSPSPWMLGAIVRHGKKTPDQSTSVHLVRMAGMAESGPKLGSFQADVQYVGDDELQVGDQKISANIYELKAPSAIPSMLVWVSSEGVVLAMQDSSRPEQRMDLVEFKRYAKF